MRKFLPCILILTLWLIVVYQPLMAQDYRLSVVIEGIHEVKGKMQVGLFSAKDDFLETGAEFSVASVVVDSTTVIVVFDGLPGATYAISLYHDLDASGEINKNFIGIPTEPYGISNDAWRRFSAPRWDEAAFTLESDKSIVIHLKH
ncbi:MAG: DUF2141 domain-containing protein [Bacteroidales bacterium]|nr:DUF2141 domain-containing protein [Bacteroidales bacterium]